MLLVFYLLITIINEHFIEPYIANFLMGLGSSVSPNIVIFRPLSGGPSTADAGI